jgi:branched-chain amino acid transport system permease protein
MSEPIIDQAGGEELSGRVEPADEQARAIRGRRPLSLFVVQKDSRAYRVLRNGFVLAVIAVAVVIPFGSPTVTNDQLSRVMMYGIAALGLNLLVGYTGQISLGHGAFFAIGAYTAAALTAKAGWHYLLTLPAAAVVAGLVGLVFGIPALRLRGLYLALVTLTLSVAIIPIIKKAKPLTGGVEGLRVPQPEPPGWLGLDPDQFYYLLILAVLLVGVLIATNLTRGNLGRALVSVRDDERAATTLGVHPARVKTGIFAVSAAFAGVAGALFALANGFVAPESFTLLLSFNFLGAIVVGGLGTISGAVLGSLFIEYAQEYAQDVNQALTGIIYGAALILVIYLLPGGAARLLRWLGGLLVGVVGSTPPRSAKASVGPVGTGEPVPTGPGATRTGE